MASNCHFPKSDANLTKTWPTFSQEDYSAVGNSRRTTLIGNGPEIGVATLKTITTLILYAPCRHAGDALQIRRSIMIFFTKWATPLIVSQPEINIATL